MQPREYFVSGVDIFQSQQYNNNRFPENQSYLQNTLPQEYVESTQPYIAKDRGLEYFLAIQNEYKNRRKVTTYSSDALFDLWKLLNKAEKSKEGVETKPKKEATSQLLKEEQQRKQFLKEVSLADHRDILYTLKLHAEEQERALKMRNFLDDANSQRSQNNKSKLSVKERSKAKDRLYKKNESFAPVIDPQIDKIRKRNLFVEQVISSYKKQNPDAKDFRYPYILVEHWSSNSKQPPGNENDFDQYYEDAMEYLYQAYYKKFGFYSESTKKIIKFWRDSTLMYEENCLFFESEENLKKLLGDFLEQKKMRDRLAVEIKQKQLQDDLKDKREKLQSQVIKKQIEKTPLQEMAKPKDRLKKGKTLLELKKMYPNDKILRRMLLQEFKDTKVAKHPLEYDIVDSDEENKVKIRHLTQSQKLEKLEEFEIPDKLKAEELAELFQRRLEEYYSKKHVELRQKLKQEKEVIKQDQQLKKFISDMAQKYLKLRQRRLEEQIPTVNQYVSQLYKTCQKNHVKALLRNFPHKTYGESKRLKKKSFPGSFKRYFFQAMRGYVRRKYDYMKDKKNRLGFWAPPNGKNMCVVHKDSLCPQGCNKQTLNHRVYEQTRMVKLAALNQQKPQTSVWDNEGYIEERKNIMMTLSDAKECTFQPAVCYRMPDKMKRIVINMHNWGQTIVGSQGTLKHFVEQFGENFKKVPMIYRFGIFKRAQVHFRKGNYKTAYQSLAEAFNIWDLKIIFKDPEVKQKKQHPIFNPQNLGIDQEFFDKQKHENLQLTEPEFQEQAEYKFLFEVYCFIKQLEAYEEELQRAKENVLKMSKSDQKFSNKSNTYNERKTRVKQQMCPLGHECPSFKTRWPNSNITGVTPLGSDCMFAHHPFELKFQQELKARRKCLESTLSAINSRLTGQLKNAPWHPSGTELLKCIGCSDKTMCSECQLKKQKLEKLNKLQVKAKKAYKKIKERKHFKEKRKLMQAHADHLNIKISCLSRANALFQKERYSEAFNVILKAVEIVKNELIETQQENEKFSQTLKTKLHLDQDMDITIKEVYSSTRQLNPDDPQEAQKLHQYAKMTGLGAQEEPDANKFINTQIEILYKKIEKKLEHTLKDIDLMKTKIEKLEDLEDQRAKSKDKKQMKMCPSLMKEGLCTKGKDCLYVHNYLDLDMVPIDNKIGNLSLSVKVKQESLINSKPPLPWIATSVKDADKYQDTHKYDKEIEQENMMKSKKTKRSQSTKSFYDQDIDDLKTPVHERKRKQ